MGRQLFLFLFLSTILFSRENPFFPIEAEDIPLTTNQYEEDVPLKRASIQLPSTARTIESVTVSYKNLDGSIAQKTIELQNSIDWHLPIFITQNYQDEKNDNSSLKQPTKQVETKKVKKIYKEIVSLPFIKFNIYKNEIKIDTEDKVLRTFLLVNPHRIVCDFKRETDIRSYIKKVKDEDVRSIKIGTHKGYYRVVIELDGSYRYKKVSTKSGYLFTLY
ncbi:AMIN domain-containing protein [Sulfurimonas sp. C5]|uniref:AMIN domain-containing protein n=1 Tax=Sulfurimonas sp. C5 TaxID=3036947 RepID=UPI002454BAD8|nr:AMIN domain-containing protein [Sulfurimonas sp. C5]MDH4944771.1 AMIN domain-containing protein [Sulfurimonas sp. C5]